MTASKKMTEAQDFAAADLDRLMAHYMHIGKELRATTLRSIFGSVFSSKPKNRDHSLFLPGALAGSAR
ncbi:MAG: hypothetical protein GY948_14805 [Alphaproteobacteria bacterium]|nr:hypothetical protein [Alphaproteobacteria bacterium]